MAEYEVLFYETVEGRCPTQDFLEELPLKVRAKITKWVDLLKREGPGLPRPYADVVRGKIRELRVSFGGMHHRLLYFFHGKRIIVTHGFVKKTAAVPDEELIRAQRWMDDFMTRVERGGIRL
jgi:phage-related protein